MLEDRNIKYPSYVLALFFGIVAYHDAMHGLQLMDAGGSAAWFIELMTAGICTVLGVLLLMRPHLWFFCAAAIWSLIGFCANFIMKMKDVPDSAAETRMTFYWIILVGACVLIVVEGIKWYEVWSKRPRPMQPWQGQYPPGYPPQMPPQYAPPPAPPAPPAAPPAAPQPPARQK
jgi:hypothetical protein